MTALIKSGANRSTSDECTIVECKYYIMITSTTESTYTVLKVIFNIYYLYWPLVSNSINC